jgi:hypothetical protein
MSTEEIQQIIAWKYKAIFNSTEEDAVRWGKRLFDTPSTKQADFDSLAVDGQKLAETFTLRWKPLYEYVLKLFDDYAIELHKRGLLKPSARADRMPFDKVNRDLIVVDRPSLQRAIVRDIRFPNGGVVQILLSQGQIHRGKIKEGVVALRFDESVNGVRYTPIRIELSIDKVWASFDKEQGGNYTYQSNWDKDPLSDQAFRHRLSGAIGNSLEFIHLNDRASKSK